MLLLLVFLFVGLVCFIVWAYQLMSVCSYLVKLYINIKFTYIQINLNYLLLCIVEIVKQNQDDKIYS